MEWQFRLNWPALVEEARQRRKSLNLTQARLAGLSKVSTPTVSRFESNAKDIQLSTVLSILEVLGMTDNRILVFDDPNPRYDSLHMVIYFDGRDGKRSVRCGISREAIDDYFLGDKLDKLKAFLRSQAKIEQLARRKYLAGEFEPDGTILVRSRDAMV